MHLFISALSQVLFGALLLFVVDAVENCPDRPSRINNSFLNCSEGWLLRVSCSSWPLSMQYYFLHHCECCFPDHSFFDKHPLWKSPSQKPFPDNPKLRHFLFAFSKGVAIIQSGLELETFQWVSALLELFQYLLLTGSVMVPAPWWNMPICRREKDTELHHLPFYLSQDSATWVAQAFSE